jgi:hypothetical protein
MGEATPERSRSGSGSAALRVQGLCRVPAAANSRKKLQKIHFFLTRLYIFRYSIAVAMTVLRCGVLYAFFILRYL